MYVIFMTSFLTKRFKMSPTLSNKGNKKRQKMTPSKVEYMETNFDLTKPRHSEQILPFPSVIQFVQIQTSFSFLLRLFLFEAKEIRDFFLSSVIRKNSLDSGLIIESFIRLIYFSKSKEHAVPFLKSNCLPLPSIFFRDCSYLLYDINRQTAPVSILNQFVKTSQIHNYRTRSLQQLALCYILQNR